MAEAIGIDELEVEDVERAVGPFSADILARNSADGSFVVIENQLERTDHRHLGQVIAYGSSLDATAIVWIASEFTEEHRGAIDWLNRVTGESIHFFGVEVGLWQIGDSPPAARFNVVAMPNDWLKLAKSRPASTTSDTSRRQLEFWRAFCQHLDRRGSFLKPSDPRAKPYLRFPLGKTGFQLSAVAALWDADDRRFTDGVLRVQLRLKGVSSKERFAALEAQRDSIEGAIGKPLTWVNPDDSQACRISLRQDAVWGNDDNWSVQHEWLRTHLERFESVFFSTNQEPVGRHRARSVRYRTESLVSEIGGKSR